VVAGFLLSPELSDGIWRGVKAAFLLEIPGVGSVFFSFSFVVGGCCCCGV